MGHPTPETTALRRERAYVFRVLYQGQPRDIPGVQGMKNGEWVMPVHPQSIQYRAQARSMIYAVTGNERGADEQGKDPPMIVMQGSFGERGAYRPGVGGMDGRQSQRAFEALIGGYLKFAHEEGMNRQPMHTLEFHDLYRNEHWVVTPQNVPYGEENSSRPLVESYQLTLTALYQADAKAIEDQTPPTQKLKGHAATCPLNPRCRFGGPSVPGCPWRKK